MYILQFSLILLSIPVEVVGKHLKNRGDLWYDGDCYWKYKSSRLRNIRVSGVSSTDFYHLVAGCWLLLQWIKTKKVTLYLFLKQFYSWEDSFLNTSCYNSVISNQNVSRFLLLYYCIHCRYKTNIKYGLTLNSPVWVPRA